MALNIKNADVERLATTIAAMTRETKTEAIRRALEERKERLELRLGKLNKRERLERFLRTQVWPNVPPEVLGSSVSKREREEILGYGPEGF